MVRDRIGGMMRYWAWLCVALGLSAGLTACGGKSDGTSASTPASFSSKALAVASTSSETTEPTSVDGLAADAPDNTEPAAL